MKISVCVPVYRCEEYIEACIASVAGQSIAGGCELVLVNNATPDSSMELARKVLARRGGRLGGTVELELAENGGPAKARELAAAAATGDYVAFLDADDALVPDALELLAARAEESCAEIVVGSNIAWGSARDGEAMDPNPPTAAEELMAAMLRGKFPGWLHGKLYARELLRRAPEAMGSGLSLCEDLYANIALLAKAQGVAAEPRAVYRYNLANMQATTKALDARSAKAAIEADAALGALVQGMEVHPGLAASLPYRHATTKLWLLLAVQPWDRSLVSLYNAERLSALVDLPLPTRAFLKCCELGLGPLVHAGVSAAQRLSRSRLARAALG